MSDKTDFDDLFNNDFFKDRFDTRVEKHLKSYNRQLEALGKKFEGYAPIILKSIMDKNKEQIAELKGRFMEKVSKKNCGYYIDKNDKQLTFLQNEINEVKERYKALMMEWSGSENDRMEIWDQINLQKSYNTNFFNNLKELKEEVKILGEVEEGQWSEMYNLKEVLWELFIKGKDMQSLYSISIELLEKLDSKEDRQPGGTGKDSGGEKEKVCETSNTTVGRMKVSKSDDSKLPEHECPYCHRLIEYRRKYKDEDEDIIYEFYCSKCKKKIRGGFPNSFLKPKEKTEPEKFSVNIDTHSKNTNEAIELFKRQIEERVRDATRKELIEEFVKTLEKIKGAIECKHGWNSVVYHIKEWRGRLEK